MAPLRYSGALSNDSYVFLSTCEDRLHCLGLLETHSVESPIF